MRLTRNFGRERMEAACKRALAIGAYRYRSVASILDKGLDRQPITPPAQAELACPSTPMCVVRIITTNPKEKPRC